MRKHGRVGGATALGAQDHICWISEQTDDWLAAALEFLAEGRRLEQRLVYVGPQPVAQLAARLAPMGDVDALVASGALALFSLDQIYDLDAALVPEEQIAMYSAVGDEAIVEGYVGLRVLADVTALVVDPARRAEHARWELLADCYMAEHLFSAMCVYERQAVGDECAGDLACVHALARAPEEVAPFSLFGNGCELALCGDVDFFSAPALARALARMPARHGDVVIDLAPAGYLDHHALEAFIDRSVALRDDGRRLVLRNASSGVRKMYATLGFDTRNMQLA
jgi:anti-anti-sigma regulatory factor